MTQPPLIASFVVRLYHETEAEGDGWRVTVTHVQSGKELRFRRLEDALPFMENSARGPSSQDEE